MRGLKLYVWEDVLCDYTLGVMFALAYSPADARARLKEVGHRYYHPGGQMDVDLQGEPKEYDQPFAYLQFGGG